MELPNIEPEKRGDSHHSISHFFKVFAVLTAFIVIYGLYIWSNPFLHENITRRFQEAYASFIAPSRPSSSRPELSSESPSQPVSQSLPQNGISMTGFVMESGRLGLSLNGTISDGDADRLRERLKANQFWGVKLNSDGGFIDEAIDMAKAIKAAHLPTMVGKNGHCDSMCLILFSSGYSRQADITATFEIARGEFDGIDSEKVTDEIADANQAFGVPDDISSVMRQTPVNRPHTLTTAEIRSMGVNLIKSGSFGSPQAVGTIRQEADLITEPKPSTLSASNPYEDLPKAKTKSATVKVIDVSGSHRIRLYSDGKWQNKSQMNADGTCNFAKTYFEIKAGVNTLFKNNEILFSSEENGFVVTKSGRILKDMGQNSWMSYTKIDSAHLLIDNYFLNPENNYARGDGYNSAAKMLSIAGSMIGDIECKCP